MREGLQYLVCASVCLSAKASGGIIESVDSICRDSMNTQYMAIQKNLAKSQKR